MRVRGRALAGLPGFLKRALEPRASSACGDVDPRRVAARRRLSKISSSQTGTRNQEDAIPATVHEASLPAAWKVGHATSSRGLMRTIPGSSRIGFSPPRRFRNHRDGRSVSGRGVAAEFRSVGIRSATDGSVNPRSRTFLPSTWPGWLGGGGLPPRCGPGECGIRHGRLCWWLRWQRWLTGAGGGATCAWGSLRRPLRAGPRPRS
jgi:hypothetical protein